MFFGKNRQELNLIPEEQQKIRLSKIKILAIFIVVIVVVAQLLIYSFIFILNQRENNKYSDLKEEFSLQETEWGKYATLVDSVKRIKSNLASYNTFIGTHPDLDQSIRKIQVVTPIGIKFSSVSITNLGEVSIQGSALSPGTIYQFINVLKEKTQDFGAVELKSIGVGEEKGYNFVINLKVL